MLSNITVRIKPFECVAAFKYAATTLTNINEVQDEMDESILAMIVTFHFGVFFFTMQSTR
jgi:hypothetical protein